MEKYSVFGKQKAENVFFNMDIFLKRHFLRKIDIFGKKWTFLGKKLKKLKF